jgi:hypothetical protein
MLGLIPPESPGDTKLNTLARILGIPLESAKKRIAHLYGR